MNEYKFSNSWFQVAKPVWDRLLTDFRPTKILEIGSFEGASACYMIEKLGAHHSIDLHCVDTWEGGIEHAADGTFSANMGQVEKRFHENLAVARTKVSHPFSVYVHRFRSDIVLATLLAQGKANYFDLIYVDGSHQAPDVLFDAVVGFKLLAVEGMMIFDDYTWSEDLPGGKDILRCPKPAIDAFVNLNFRKLRVLNEPTNQFYVVKTSD